MSAICTCGQERHLYYRRDGTVFHGDPNAAALAWARSFGDADRRRVAVNSLWNGVFVSTVSLGMDHNWGGGPPLIYETMAFHTSDQHDPQERYSTEAEALAGHRKMVARYRWDIRAAVAALLHLARALAAKRRR